MKKVILFFLVLSILSCNKKDESISQGSGDWELGKMSDAYRKFSENVLIYVEDDYIVFETDNLPNHKSPYYNENNVLYEEYNGNNQNFNLNPNKILKQNIVMKVPADPKESKTKTATPLGAIGIAVNGVVFYNQYAGPNNQPLTNEINSFDQYNGHPQPQGAYHYHIEPLWLTSNLGKDAFLGFLNDGFPVYGPQENGKDITNTDLDDYHGHFHKTDEFPDGIYHYHITKDNPYINGDGFFGVVGTISQ